MSSQKPIVDLNGDNRLPEILEERAELKKLVKLYSERLKEIDAELDKKLGVHELGWVRGYRIARRTRLRKAYQVPAGQFSFIEVRHTRELNEMKRTIIAASRSRART